MNFAEVLWWTEKLIALAVLQQSAEQLFLNQAFSAHGGWRWATLRKEFKNLPGFVEFLYSRVIPHPVFSSLRILAALGLFLFPNCVFSLFLLLTQLLLLSRWRGNFNGGSDHMTVILLGTLSLAQVFPNTQIAQGALLYLGLQSIFSYLIGGWVKIKRANWRQGKALPVFISLSSYAPNTRLRSLFERPGFTTLLSWLGMLFELSVVVAAFYPPYLPVFFLLGACFHLLNFYLLGLNRFVFVWVATYPAIIWTSMHLSPP